MPDAGNFVAKCCASYYKYKTCDKCLHKVFPQHMMLLLNVPDEDAPDHDREWAGRMNEMKRPIGRAVKKIDDVEKRVGGIEQQNEKIEKMLEQQQQQQQKMLEQQAQQLELLLAMKNAA